MALSSSQRSGNESSSSSAVVRPAPTNEQHQQQQEQSSAAAATVKLLLQEDPLLTQHELHVNHHHDHDNDHDAHVCAYAAALLLQDDHEQVVETRATQALEDVQRKLTLVESLAERVSRTSPEAVAGPLLKLHGYTTLQHEQQDESSEEQQQQPMTLVATREKCHRLERQGQVLEGVANRVESSLTRGLVRMQKATNRLKRVLDLSFVLKQILRLLFESTKLQGYDLDDLRDLTRAAASVAILQELMAKPELSCGIDVVEDMRPYANTVSNQVRQAAATLLDQFHQSKSSSVVQLGATLQVYYHLGELPQAAWNSVQHGLDAAQQAMEQLFSSANLQKLQDTATAQAKAAVGTKHKPGDTERALQKKLRELRAQAATAWATRTLEAARLVWNLQFVLCRKSDPVTRQVFIDLVAASPIPSELLLLLPPQKTTLEEFSVFGIYWHNLCAILGNQLNQVLEESEKDKFKRSSLNVAGLYPAVRAAALDMLSSLYDTMHAGSLGSSTASSGLALEDTAASTSTTSGGVLGGSAGLADSFLECSISNPQDDDPYAFLGTATADTWTRADNTTALLLQDGSSDRLFSSSGTTMTTSSLSAIFQSPEWQALQGNNTIENNEESMSLGLYGLQQAFLQASHDRLCEPLQYMFPSSGVTLDDDGHAISVLPTLPSRYDLQRLDQSIRQELALADPREGGGELSMVTMLCNVIVDMAKLFCERTKGVVSGAGQGGYLVPSKVAPTDDLLHDLKVSKVMNALAVAVRSAPENTFVVPYRPATSVQHEEAANMCQTALLPALVEIENMVKTLILTPLCRALNQRVADAIAKVHHGTYLGESLEGMEGTGTSFVQKHLAELYEGMADTILSKLPKEYAGIVASTVATFSIYTFVSNISMIRPLGETARLHITQDLADFELALEQLVFKANSSMTLSQMHNGKPYAELRAVRQMLFWTGLDDQTASPAVLTKSLLRELWIKDVRPSTVIHFLFSFAPPLLSSPQHAKRTTPEKYIQTLVELDGTIDDGEASAWMVTMECCESYQQRESVGRGDGGDARVAAILMSLGPELLRRYRH